MNNQDCVIFSVGIRLGIGIVAQTGLVCKHSLHSRHLEDIQSRTKCLDLQDSCLAVLGEKELGTSCRFQKVDMGFIGVSS